jgi:hypothetical protein
LIIIDDFQSTVNDCYYMMDVDIPFEWLYCV